MKLTQNSTPLDLTVLKSGTCPTVLGNGGVALGCCSVILVGGGLILLAAFAPPGWRDGCPVFTVRREL